MYKSFNLLLCHSCGSLLRDQSCWWLGIRWPLVPWFVTQQHLRCTVGASEELCTDKTWELGCKMLSCVTFWSRVLIFILALELLAAICVENNRKMQPVFSPAFGEWSAGQWGCGWKGSVERAVRGRCCSGGSAALEFQVAAEQTAFLPGCVLPYWDNSWSWLLCWVWHTRVCSRAAFLHVGWDLSL